MAMTVKESAEFLPLFAVLLLAWLLVVLCSVLLKFLSCLNSLQNEKPQSSHNISCNARFRYWFDGFIRNGKLYEVNRWWNISDRLRPDCNICLSRT